MFRSQILDGPGDLYVMALDGTGLRRVTREGDFFVPEWAADGQSIAFRQKVEGLSAEVGVAAPDGSSSVVLTQGEHPRLSNMAVHWLPGGEELAYSSWPSLNVSELWAISRFGGAPRRLLSNIEGSQEAATWSPSDSSTLVYTDFVGSTTRDLWSVSTSDAAEPVNLTEGRVYAPRFPEWSPDGTRIVFAGYAILDDGTVEGLATHGSGGFKPPDSEIFVIDVESRRLTRVTDNVWDDTTPTWAPDGEQLLIASLRDGDSDLWLVPLDAPEQAQNLIDDADAPREDVMPDWYRALP